MSVTAVPLRPLARGSVLKLWIGLAVLALAAAGLAWVGTSGQQVITTASGLRYRVLEEGSGPTVTPADLVALRYKLRKEDGTLIQDSDQTGQPFVTGTEGLFPGFSEGLQLMQAGGRYMLWIPPGLHVQQAMPPGAPFSAEDTLVFEIEVLQIAPGMAAMQQLMGPQGAGPHEGAEPAEDAAPGERAGRPSREGASKAPAEAPAAPAGNRQ
jgi:FKBP-type peptidyl-prolyl cis-trans isomerase FkpA